MSTPVETGCIPLSDGAAIPWARQQLSSEEARSFRAQAQLQTYRVTTVAETRDGGLVVSKYAVPGAWLADFLFGETWKLANVPGEDRRVLTIEAVGDS